MSATITNLKDENRNTVYPVTKTNAVLDSNNVDVDTLISNEITARQNADTNLQSQINTLAEEKASYFNSEDFGASNTRLTMQGDTDTFFRSYTFTSKGRPFVFCYGINCVCDKYLLAFDIYVDGVKKTNVFMMQTAQGNDNNTVSNSIYGSQVITGVGAGTHTISVYVNNKFSGDSSTMYVRNYSRISTTIFEI